jgi:DNA-binding MarR family transcriptional regulator
MAKTPAPPPEDPAAIADELQAVVGAVVRQMRSASPARDISLSQVSILKRLHRDGPHTVAGLARLDKITHQSVTVAVNALEERALVRRMADSGDLRRKLLIITDIGRDLLAERREAGQDNLATAITKRLTDAEQAQLGQALTLIRRLLG